MFATFNRAFRDLLEAFEVLHGQQFDAPWER